MAKKLGNRLFRASQNKITATIMVLLTLILLGTLLTISLTTYRGVYRNNQRILEVFLEDHIKGMGPRKLQKMLRKMRQGSRKTGLPRSRQSCIWWSFLLMEVLLG